jgi:hypothetical protein
MHVHLPTVSFLGSAIRPFREPAEKFFRRKVEITRMEEVAKHYEKLDIVGVLLAWDAETATGLPPPPTTRSRASSPSSPDASSASRASIPGRGSGPSPRSSGR